MKYLFAFLFAFLWTAAATVQAQDKSCQPDVASLRALMEGQVTLDTLRHIQSEVELMIAACVDYAPADAGNSRTNPVSFGQAQDVNVSRGDFIGTIRVLEYIDDAEEMVLSAASFNDPAPEGTRYIAVRLELHCGKEASESCEFKRIDLSVAGDKGQSYRYDSGDAYNIHVGGVTDDIEIFGGATTEMTFAWVVPADDGHFVIFPEYGDPRVFFAVE